MVSFMLRPLYLLGKSLLYPLLRRLYGPQIRSGRGGKEKIPFIAPAGNRTLSSTLQPSDYAAPGGYVASTNFETKTSTINCAITLFIHPTIRPSLYTPNLTFKFFIITVLICLNNIRSINITVFIRPISSDVPEDSLQSDRFT